MKQRKKGWILAEKRLLVFLLVFVMTAAPVISPFLTAEAATIENPWDGVTLTKPEIDRDGTYLIRTGARACLVCGRGKRRPRRDQCPAGKLYLSEQL